MLILGAWGPSAYSLRPGLELGWAVPLSYWAWLAPIDVATSYTGTTGSDLKDGSSLKVSI